MAEATGSSTGRGLRERLSAGETVVVAEGYLFAFERRGYLRAGPYVPDVVLRHPELVRQQHEEFVRAGSDVVLAFTYWAHREKMRKSGLEDEVETLNRRALKIAREVADENRCLMAGNISNSTMWDDPKQHEAIHDMFKEQIEWAVEEGANYIVGETFRHFGEAKLALECIKKYGKGLPAVITLACIPSATTVDGMSWAEACRLLEDLGAAVVGLNCHRGPESMLPVLEEIRRACKGPLAAIPVPYRTNDAMKSFMSLTDPDTGTESFPDDLDRWYCSRSQLAHFARAACQIGVQYIGLCCGANAGQLRAVSETVGHTPPASRYSSGSFNFGQYK